MPELIRLTTTINGVTGDLTLTESTAHGYVISFHGDPILCLTRTGKLDRLILASSTPFKHNKSWEIKTTETHPNYGTIPQGAKALIKIDGDDVLLSVTRYDSGAVHFSVDNNFDGNLFSLTGDGMLYRTNDIGILGTFTAPFKLNKRKQIKWEK